ncbi:MAG: NAD(P)/FAD-dependent oxidoreductase, partial [Ruegeria sp.]
VDLLPDLAPDALRARLAEKKQKMTLSQWLKKGLRLPPQKVALFHEMTVGQSLAPEQLVGMLKNLPLHGAGLRPLDEAISTAGGVTRAALDDGLMLRALPGVFCAGEMLDWEAPTGGYLLTACLATGRWAGISAVRWLDQAG